MDDRKAEMTFTVNRQYIGPAEPFNSIVANWSQLLQSCDLKNIRGRLNPGLPKRNPGLEFQRFQR